ncbi:hypothetical protein O1Q96_26720 [Streptomyces sp. Qhu-G9]|uniref:hypothetical protein n=1 Tax=Streptomyces sp. Qhu-G9 TaxID=3452799 RepID=UPI0022AC2D5B|nr:hypothetical protein [Streptomyces aurantiacus]WAU82961.1 hypothetical protein O1Q96_26720 [Streptomyces aurantiacus]
MTDRVGSLRPGKQADVIPLRLENINCLTVERDPIAAVVTAAHPHNVDTVLMAGPVMHPFTCIQVSDTRGAVVRARAPVGGEVSVRPRNRLHCTPWRTCRIPAGGRSTSNAKARAWLWGACE